MDPEDDVMIYLPATRLDLVQYLAILLTRLEY